MKDFIENNDARFANGQVSCDLRGNSDARESETQLDAVNVIEQCPDVAPEEFPAPIGKLLGLMITSSGTGRATVEFEASGRYANPMGTRPGIESPLPRRPSRLANRDRLGPSRTVLRC